MLNHSSLLTVIKLTLLLTGIRKPLLTTGLELGTELEQMGHFKHYATTNIVPCKTAAKTRKYGVGLASVFYSLSNCFADLVDLKSSGG